MRKSSGTLGSRWGRTRERLAELLEKEGFTVELLFAVQGFYRTSQKADCYRWEASGKNKDGFLRNLASWETMSDCVKKGASIDWKSGEVWTKEKK